MFRSQPDFFRCSTFGFATRLTFGFAQFAAAKLFDVHQVLVFFGRQICLLEQTSTVQSGDARLVQDLNEGAALGLVGQVKGLNFGVLVGVELGGNDGVLGLHEGSGVGAGVDGPEEVDVHGVVRKNGARQERRRATTQ